ncbi:MAG: IPT/TIG domain-containing protein, partial [Planctomycetota bacterium]
MAMITPTGFVDWTATPAAQYQTGQNIPLHWKTSAATTDTEIWYDTSPRFENYKSTTSQSGGAATYSDSVVAPGVGAATTYYFRAHGVINGVDYFSNLAQITINPGPAPTISGVAPAQGIFSGGTAVTITGTNFVQGSNNTGVTFGASAATNVVVVSATQITCVTAAGSAGAVDVKVTNPDTQVATAAGAFTYTSPPVIFSVTAVSGSAGLAFGYQIMAHNGPTSYNATPLPAGLSVNTSSGAITGTATAAGSTSTTLSATNAYGTGSATLAITITTGGTPGATVTTLAGPGESPGALDGGGSGARFNVPVQIAVDGVGNIYVADQGNHVIRKVTPAGLASTLAGLAGSPGSADGQGNVARFNNPNSVAVDGNGNVYVADSSNQTIRKITPGGQVTTLAGQVGKAGYKDATGTAAQFSFTNGNSLWGGLAADNSGNVYVADSSNHVIRVITPAGVVSTLAGKAGSAGNANGQGTSAQFNCPIGLCVDGNGNVYVADTANDTIRLVTPQGNVTTLAGSAGSAGSQNGTGSAARFNRPWAIAVDSAGNLYVADTNNHSIRMITPATAVTTLAGSPGSAGWADGTGNAALFNWPEGVAVVGAAGSVTVYVGDNGNSVIRQVSAAGAVTTLSGAAPTAGSVDGTGAAARFNGPVGTATDSAGNVYVADHEDHTIRKITPAGVVSTFAGAPGMSGTTDGNASAARFNHPGLVALDSSGNVYVGDQSN